MEYYYMLTENYIFYVLFFHLLKEKWISRLQYHLEEQMAFIYVICKRNSSTIFIYVRKWPPDRVVDKA